MEKRMEAAMETGGLDQAYTILFMAVLVVLALLLMLCLVRAIMGPRIADRVVSVNMMGTMVIVMIAILAIMLGEGYLVDVCIVYALISFLAVIVLTKVYMGVYLEKKEAEADRAGREKEGLDKVYIAGLNAEEKEEGLEAVPQMGTDGMEDGSGGYVTQPGREDGKEGGLR